MTTFPEDPRPTPYDARPQDKAGPDVQEKEYSKGENVPGWSFMMRPLRRKGGKATETTHAARLDSSNDKGDIARINGQTDDDRRSAQSKASAYGLEHSETLREVTSEDGLLPEEHQGQVHAAKDGEGNDPQQSSASGESPLASEGPRFKVYKRRWFGVVQLALLNTIVSWDVSARDLLSLWTRVYLFLLTVWFLTFPAVALFRGQLDDGLSVLWGISVRCQLAQHCFPLCVCRCLTPGHAHSQPWRAQAIHHDSSCSDTSWKLDKVWCYEGWPQRELWGCHVWTIIDRICTTLCSFSSN